MPITASNSIATNTGAAALVEGLIWFEGSSSGATGPLRRQRPKHVITLPGSQTMTGNSMPGFTQANGFSTNLERFADFTRDAVSWDFPAYVDEAGTVSSAFSVKDEDGTTDTATAVNTTVSAIGSYTSRVYVDAAASNTEGEVYQTNFDDASTTGLDAITADSNAYNRDFSEARGSFEANGSGAMVPTAQDGSGHNVGVLDFGVTEIVMEAVVETTGNENFPNSFILRYGAGTDWLVIGLDYQAQQIQLIDRSVGGAQGTVIATDNYTFSLNTDYTVKVTDDGSEINFYVNDVLEFTHTTSQHSGNTQHGIGGIGIGSGSFNWKSFSFGLLNDGGGLATDDKISNIDNYSALMDANIDSIITDVAPGTYSPTRSIPVAQGTNAVIRWGTADTKPVLDTKDIPVGTDLFKVGQSSVTSRRASLRGFEITNSEAVHTELDLSSSSVLNTATNEITSATLYSGASQDDPILVAPGTGSIPAGLSANTVYYMDLVSTNVFRLLDAPGGSVVNITGLSTGAKTHLVRNGGQDIFDWNGNHIDLALVDLDVASDCADYTFRGIENTFGTSDRLACIRVFKNNPKMWRYCIGIFGGPTYAEVDCGGGSVSSERTRRYSCGTNTLTVLGSYGEQLNDSGKNSCRIQANGKSTFWAVNFVGSRVSLGGDAGDANEVRIESSHLNGVEVFDAGDLCLASPIITDQRVRPVSGNEAAGADFPGAVGIRRANSADSNTATGGFDVLNPIISFTGQGLASSQLFINIGGSDAANVASNVNVENALCTTNGNTSAADRAVAIEHSPASAVLNNCTIPQQETTSGNTGVVGSINGANVNETTFDSNAATANTTFADVLHDEFFQPTGGDSGNIPNGVFNDAFGFGVDPGDGGVVGSVQGLADLSIEINGVGNTADIVALLTGASNVWGTPLTGVGKTLTLTGSTSGTIIATIPDEAVGVVVSNTTTIADTATYTASLDKTVNQGETVTVLRADIGIIDEVFSEDWQSEGLPTGAAVTNSSTQGGVNSVRASALRVPVVLQAVRRSRIRRR